MIRHLSFRRERLETRYTVHCYRIARGPASDSVSFRLLLPTDLIKTDVQGHSAELISIIIIIIIHEFHRDASHSWIHYSCNANAAVADSLRCRMICGTVPSSVHAWMPPATTATWSPAAAHSKPLPRCSDEHPEWGGFWRWDCPSLYS